MAQHHGPVQPLMSVKTGREQNAGSERGVRRRRMRVRGEGWVEDGCDASEES